MSPTEWGLVVLICYPLLQLPVIVYLSRYVEMNGEELPRSPTYATGSIDGGGELDSDARPSRSPASHAVSCSYCGTENDHGFTYCRNCVTNLS